MRRFLIVLATLVVCSAPTWADSIELDVNAWATITAPNGAVEKIDVSFLWQNVPIGCNQAGVCTGVSDEIVAGSLDVQSSGFMGTFSPSSPQGNNLFYLGLFNNLAAPTDYTTDEFDLYYSKNPSNLLAITPGINTLDGFAFWSCETQACSSAYGQSWIGGAPPLKIQQGSYVTTVPDGDSPVPISLSAFGAFALAWRWRR